MGEVRPFAGDHCVDFDTIRSSLLFVQCFRRGLFYAIFFVAFMIFHYAFSSSCVTMGMKKEPIPFNMALWELSLIIVNLIENAAHLSLWAALSVG